MRNGCFRGVPGWLGSAALVVTMGLAASCDRAIDDATLTREREEAEQAEAAARARFGTGDERTSWTLTVTGRVPSTVVLPFREVERLATTEYLAKPTNEHADPPPALFRGARLSELLARANAPEDATEVTLVANDGFRATFAAADVRTYPVMLSVLWDGVPITRSRGGPLFATLPNYTEPAIEERYSYSWWVFYVTHLVVDTAEVSVRVGDCTLDAAELAALPAAEVAVRHGFRVGWPSGELRIAGVRVRDVLAACHADLGPNDRARVRVMAPVPDGDDHAVRLGAEAIATTDVLLGLRFGADDQPIPARLGGPVVLAFPPGDTAGATQSEWPTYVRGLDIERGGEP